MVKDVKLNGFNEIDIFEPMEQKPIKLDTNISWYYAPAFLGFWLMLFTAIVLPIFFLALPSPLGIQNEQARPTEFIAERAERILLDFELIGPKVTGSWANENQTVQLLLDEIEKIRQNMQHDLFDLELDVQRVSGAFTIWNMVNMYQGLQNVVVKFSAKNTKSNTFLLINSHFDSKPGSPGSGDDGAMVVVMLEVLRVLATNRRIFTHPIIFLFNGAEEIGLQASHGFITQHKWAKNCSALINLDSAGSGNREVLFQTGPNHPWLLKYYAKHAKHPFATTLAEEMFQAGIIPSDTDFRIFRDYGNVPGLDMAHAYNGYVYHTAFDKMDVIPRATLQNTGDNLLALARALADAPELENTSQYTEGHVVFYDYMNLFFIYYTYTEGVIINTIVALATLILVAISIWRMSVNTAAKSVLLMRSFAWILLLQLVGLALAFALPLLMAVFFDSGDRSMTWFTSKWLVFGLYVCPCLLGLVAPPLIYLSLQNEKWIWKIEKQNLSAPYKLQMVLHAHGTILSIILLVITFMGIRTSYLLMMSLFFYAISLIVNLVTKLHDRGYQWTVLHTLSQIMPFLYFVYTFHALNCILMPMMGRFGDNVNPDLIIAVLNTLASILAMGFLIPLLSAFKQSKFILIIFVIISFIFSMLALTHLGFPYRAKTNVKRTDIMHMQRVYYEYDGTVSRNDSGFLLNFWDRRGHHPLESYVNLTGRQQIEHCYFYLTNPCDWLPSQQPIQIPGQHTLKLLQKSIHNDTMKARFDFELNGTPQMNMLIVPLVNVTITDWSFPKELLQRKPKRDSYRIYYSHGVDNTPLRFHIEVELSTGSLSEPLFMLGLNVYYVSFEHRRGDAELAFMRSFPDFVHLIEWPNSFERYVF